MKISIITPTWNSEKTIENTCRSILMQEYSELEHVIIDNCSNDKTAEIIKKIYPSHFDYKFISEKDKGISDAFNKGIKNSSGEVIAILNSDDFYLNPRLLADVMEIFKQDCEVQIVHGDMYFEDHVHGSNLRRPLLCPIDFAMPLNHPTMFVRSDLYQKFGLFREDYRIAMDFEFINRFYKNKYETLCKIIYFKNYPMVKMNAGGASYKLETKSLYEVKNALIEHDRWSFIAGWYWYNRRIRVFLKMKFFSGLFSPVISVWRKLKWG